MHRAARLVAQFAPATEGQSIDASECATVSLEEHADPLRWNGWGYKDTMFELNEAGQVCLKGNRYLFSGQNFPDLKNFFIKNVGLDISVTSKSQEMPPLPSAVTNEPFLAAIKQHYKKIATSDVERCFHSHGHTAQEVYTLRMQTFPRYVDLVVWPGSHADVEVIVEAANVHNVVLIPFGGGTSVTQALLCPANEKRMIVSVDMHMMNNIKWINRKNMVACIEAGAVGKDLEEQLKKFALCLGHEPDSAEFSTLGGWIATRASGMRKNKYGNIEDIALKIKTVTSLGTVEKGCLAPRVSVGPDLHEMVLGSEGTLGIVTEVVCKVRHIPTNTRYGSILFPDFENGVACMHEIAMLRAAPVSIRLVDNMQFQFGQALKPEVHDWKEQMMDKAKKWYVTKHKKFDPEHMTAATLLLEGSPEEIKQQEKTIYTIAAKYGGLKAGETNGIRGYFLTYMIAYLRDFGFDYQFMAESFETSVPWDHVYAVCQNVKNRIREDAKEQGIKFPPFVSCRVTQTYDNGACIYFYFGFLWTGLANPTNTFDIIEHNAREEILKLGGSLSHHHGVGKLRKAFMSDSVSPTGLKILQQLKQAVDPKNIFANGNLVDLP